MSNLQSKYLLRGEFGVTTFYFSREHVFFGIVLEVIKSLKNKCMTVNYVISSQLLAGKHEPISSSLRSSIENRMRS